MKRSTYANDVLREALNLATYINDGDQPKLKKAARDLAYLVAELDRLIVYENTMPQRWNP